MNARLGPWIIFLCALLLGDSIVHARVVDLPAGTRVIDVRADFGAVGDGVADDTAALNAAFAAARQPGGASKIVYIPDGTYRISDTVGYNESRIVIQGQSESGTIIRLDDNATGFAGPDLKVVFDTRFSTGFSANQFRVSIFDLTIETGSGNPQAIALDYNNNNNNNQGTLRNVTIRSGDGQGFVGLNITGTDRGPGMVRNVEVVGFDQGIRMSGTEYSMVFEDITLTDQNEVAIFNVWNILTIRNLTSNNSVPVVTQDLNTTNGFTWGMVSILDATLSGGAPGTSALVSDSSLYLRNVTSSGYASLVEFRGNVLPFTGTAGLANNEYISDRVQSIFPSEARSLGLPILDVPTVAWDDPANASGDPSGWWANVEDFGANGTDGANDGDDSIGIQAAIDSGATSIYFPTGRYFVASPIVLRGNVRRVYGVESNIDAIDPLLSSNAGVFQTDPSNAGPIVVERMGIGIGDESVGFDHTTTGTLVVRNITGGRTRSDGGGDLFVEDAVSGPHLLRNNGRAWYRQLNPENTDEKVIVDGAQAVILGLKTEKQGTPVVARGGASLELIGGLIYPVQTLPLDQPMIIDDNSDVSVIIGESSFSGDSNHKIVVDETRGSETRRLFDFEVPTRVGFGRGVRMNLYAGIDSAVPPTPSAAIVDYPLDESGGTNVPDASGNANDGTTFGGPSWVAGLNGNALSFDGIDDSAVLPQGLASSERGSVSLWFNSSFAYTGTGHMFYFSQGNSGNGGGGDNEAHLSFNSGGTVSFFINGSSNLVVDSAGPWNDGAWHHAVAVWDVDRGADLYIDGQRVDSSTFTGWNVFDTTSGNVRLGRPNANSRFYNGLLDDVLVWDRAIDHNEVLDLFVNGVGFANYPPNVGAGRDQTIQDPSYSKQLEGQAIDDLQPVGIFNIEWTLDNGPAMPTLSDSGDPTALATYPGAGQYVLRLSADDTVDSREDTVTINVFDPLPSPYSNNDVGSVGADGWAVSSDGEAFQLNASGSRVAGNPASGGVHSTLCTDPSTRAAA